MAEFVARLRCGWSRQQIAARPYDVAGRGDFDHGEGDLMIFARCCGNATMTRTVVGRRAVSRTLTFLPQFGANLPFEGLA